MYKCWAKDHFIVVIQVSFNNRTPNEVASRKKIKRKNLNGEKEMCYTKMRCSRPARGGVAGFVTTMHIFDLTRISRYRCPPQAEHDESVFVRVGIRPF